MIHPSAFIAPGAVVLGDVTVGRDTSVWYNCVVRGDMAPIVIGEETNIQDLSMVHVDEGVPSTIGSSTGASTVVNTTPSRPWLILQPPRA